MNRKKHSILAFFFTNDSLIRYEKEQEEEIENQPIDQPEPSKSPIVEQELPPPPVENNPKRRTTRRTTTRLLRENQNGIKNPLNIQVHFISILDNLPPVEIPTKTRYATRYSTRLAASVIHEVSITRTSTVHRRTTRFTSE
jgi:hypothetical protein